MNALFLMLVAQASQPASQPSMQTGGTAADLTGSVTWIYQVDEQVLRVQESWSVNNQSGKLVDKDEVVFRMPANTRRLNVDEDAQGFAGNEESTLITATEAIGAGTKQFGDAHMIDFDGSTVTVRRQIPIKTMGARLIIENIKGLEVTSNVEFTQRVSELNGLEFQVIEFAPIARDTTLEVTFDGLPSKVTWPRRAAVALALLVVGWMIWALRSPTEERAEKKMGPLSAQARRDQIVKAIEILERDLSEDKIKPKRYERRYKELMQELAAVLREIELSKQKRAAERS